jgi:hypothetical protein
LISAGRSLQGFEHSRGRRSALSARANLGAFKKFAFSLRHRETFATFQGHFDVF